MKQRQITKIEFTIALATLILLSAGLALAEGRTLKESDALPSEVVTVKQPAQHTCAYTYTRLENLVEEIWVGLKDNFGFKKVSGGTASWSKCDRLRTRISNWLPLNLCEKASKTPGNSVSAPGGYSATVLSGGDCTLLYSWSNDTTTPVQAITKAGTAYIGE